MTLLCDISQIELFHKNKTQAGGDFDDTPYAVFVQVYPAIVILNAVKNPCILPEVP